MELFETRESMFRVLTEWDKITFSQALAVFDTTNKNPEAVELMKEVVRHQRLQDVRMNGKCSENLRILEKERMRIVYAHMIEVLNEEQEYWTPLDVIYRVCENNVNDKKFYERKAKAMEMSFQRLTSLMCGRALRALPSFVREYQLRNALKNRFKGAFFEKSEELDTRTHCDVKMTIGENEYYFWSFVPSGRGIKNFSDKFKGNRGALIDGVHVICPLDPHKPSKHCVFKEWCMYPNGYMDEIAQAIYNREHIKYADVCASAMMLEDSFYNHPVAIDKYVVATSVA